MKPRTLLTRHRTGCVDEIHGLEICIDRAVDHETGYVARAAQQAIVRWTARISQLEGLLHILDKELNSINDEA